MPKEIEKLLELAEDPFEKPTTSYPDEYYDDFDFNGSIYLDIFIVISRGILFLGVLTVDIITVYIILKFKRLKSRVNYYVLYYATFNVISFFYYPIFMIYILIFPYGYSESYCVIQEAYYTTFVLCMIANALLAFEYSGQKFNWNIGSCIYRAKITFFVLAFLQFFVTSGFCLSGKYRDIPLGIALCSELSYIIYLLIILTVNIANWIKSTNIKDKYKHILIIVNINALCWLPQFLYDFLFTVVDDVILFTILLYTEFLPETLILIHPAISFFILYMCNKNFKVAVDKVFRRNKDYSGDIDNFLENESSEDDDKTNEFTEVQETTSVYC